MPYDAHYLTDCITLTSLQGGWDSQIRTLAQAARPPSQHHTEHLSMRPYFCIVHLFTYALRLCPNEGEKKQNRNSGPQLLTIKLVGLAEGWEAFLNTGLFGFQNPFFTANSNTQQASLWDREDYAILPSSTPFPIHRSRLRPPGWPQPQLRLSPYQVILSCKDTLKGMRGSTKGSVSSWETRVRWPHHTLRCQGEASEVSIPNHFQNYYNFYMVPPRSSHTAPKQPHL